MSLKVGIVGAAGYAGAELIRLVLGHPEFELVAITSNADAGQPLSAVYPSFAGVSDLVFTTHDAPELKSCDAVFLAVPHTAAMAQVPALLAAGVGGYALFRGTDVFSALTDGALQGLRTVGRIAPVLVCLLPAVGALRASGAIDAFTALLRPALSFLGIPAETVPLMLLRPMSGSGALAVAGDIFTACGADSPAGRTAAVMLGSTETTFYVLSVYFGAAGVRKTRHAVPAALCADLAGFLAAAFCVNVLHL